MTRCHPSLNVLLCNSSLDNRPIPLYQPKMYWSNNSGTEITVRLRALRQRLRSPESEKTLFTMMIWRE